MQIENDAAPKVASDTAQAEIKRLRGLLIDPGTPPWEDARAVLVAELRKAGYSTHADNVEAAHGVLIPSDIALNLIAQASRAKVASDTGAITPEWCLRMAELEAGQEIGAGALDHPLRIKCELPPAGWVCTREPGHDGPCAAVASDTGADREAIAKLHALQHDNCLNAAKPVWGGSIIQWAADEISALRASGTGVGYALLREQLYSLADVLDMSVEQEDHFRDRMRCYLAMHEALATPTDATDGATGGGEVQMLRETLIKMGRMLPGVLLDDRVSSELLTYLPAELEAALATTPGGDSLEQAARGKVELLFDQAFADGIAAGKSGDDSILAGSSSAYAQAAIRALKPAGDGGEA